MIKVSNSEALSLSCEAKWMYAFHPGYNLEPKSLSIALTRGNVGHAALEIFFKSIMEGIPRRMAESAARNWLVAKMGQAASNTDLRLMQAVTELIPIIDQYFESKILNNFLASVNILGVEVEFDTELPGGFILPGRADLVVYYTKGPYKGETAPVDNKFVYNFWSEDDFRMNSQIPLYLHGFRTVYPNAVIRRGIINQIRHRSNAVDRFIMTPITPERGEINNIVGNHIRQSMRVAELKALSKEDITQSVQRTLSKYTCGNCGFRELCKSELTNGNTRDLIKMSFQPNSYGYGGDEED